MPDYTTMTIREIALEMPETTRVFEEFKIDYCCGGRIPFYDACRSAGLDPLTVLLKIEAAAKEHNGRGAEAPERKSMSGLVDHIVDTHHVFTRSEIERLIPLMDKVCGKHGSHFPELYEIKQDFDVLADELLRHMLKEEMVLFPYIKQLESSLETGEPVGVPHFGTVQNPVRMMMFEHDTAGDLLKSIRSHTDDFTPPEGACPSYTALYAGLHDLERDLHQHIHLENNVLFPQAIEAESKISLKEGSDSAPACIASSLF